MRPLRGQSECTLQSRSRRASTCANTGHVNPTRVLVRILAGVLVLVLVLVRIRVLVLMRVLVRTRSGCWACRSTPGLRGRRARKARRTP